MKWQDKEWLLATKQKCNENVYQWVSKAYNLTSTIKKTELNFSLNLLSQKMETPYADELLYFQTIEIDAAEAMVRKVLLLGNQIPLIYARVIIPDTTYKPYKTLFDNLGTSPIGETLLFPNKQITRSDFEYKYIDDQDEFFTEIQQVIPNQHQENFFARRSLFQFPHGPILISEVFFNTLPLYP